MDAAEYLLTVTVLAAFTFALRDLGAPYIIAVTTVLAAYVLGYLDAQEVYTG